MMTPLFPKHNGRILMQQGDIGDCYLLTALDCIFTSGHNGYKYIKSMFTEVPGGVIVRLRHNSESINLKPALIESKYGYYHDKDRRQDVFFLSNERLHAIDTSRGGVRTNSLAVKILEHLSSYYYVSSAASATNTTITATAGAKSLRSYRRSPSLLAHDFRDRYPTSSTIFVAKILGLYAHDQLDINNIIKIKTICPEQPIYISMLHGQASTTGRRHNRHALRIDTIMPNSDIPGEYNFVLVNPWDNALSENYSFAELERRKCRFSIFMTDRQKQELIFILMHAPEKLGQDVFANSELLKMIFLIKSLLGVSFSLDDIEYCAMLNLQNNRIPGIFNQLDPYEQQTLAIDMSVAKNKQQGPLNLKIMGFFETYSMAIRRSELSIDRVRLESINARVETPRSNIENVPFIREKIGFFSVDVAEKRPALLSLLETSQPKRPKLDY